ncbi:hypothetical protein M440DRAFT_1436725 [Trichoderma longibrachiatum ATCC 18648]|uniref:Pinin/SDK/MemA protein domain-containing protein n=1 Tax=Trichoderma longibrachiatum ATCC 18648 TaxID=983965 RepID=A0A2T4CD09_TRILO|nr:hypothetical protein M440DRAFT_1436725 [Trichoderma longibrachiatum ATCC 18648]
MATMGETETETETVVPKPMEESQATPDKAPDMSLKRKADDEAPEEDSSKRVKHSDGSDDKAPGDDAAPLQRAPTLSQTSNTSQQQKRRQEIERRQQDRMQKQMAEDDQRRSERLEKLRASRMADQIVFEEQVMKKKHENRLAMAKFLRTRAEPAIFYLPWRTTSTQKDIIEDQIEKARIANDREAEQFKARKQRHIERYGPPTRQRSVTPDEPAAARAPEGESPPRSPRHGSADKPQVQERRASSDGQHKGHHDELGDDLEEAEEDMVIY